MLAMALPSWRERESSDLVFIADERIFCLARPQAAAPQERAGRAGPLNNGILSASSRMIWHYAAQSGRVVCVCRQRVCVSHYIFVCMYYRSPASELFALL